jgi:ATP-dependent helicase/nuclease subunit A
LTDPLDLGLATDSNNENETRSIRESRQIQLMTIHGSKGLEFDHVVLPFLNHHRKKESTDFWTIDLANRHWSVAMVDPKTRTTRSGFYARNISDEVTKLLEEESERLFYVAVTRARRGLHFFPPKAIDDLSPTGWARHLTPFIEKGEGHFKSDGGRYEFVVMSEEQIPIIAEHRTPDVVALTPVPPLPPLVERSRDTISITELVSQTADAVKDFRHTPIWETEILERGVKIHRELEAYAASGATTFLSPELSSWLEETEVPLKKILQNGFPEWPFSIKTKTKTIDGQIDLWGRDDLENLWIIDYKTGSSRFVEKAFKQLRLYAWALKQSPFYRTNEPIHLAVCYPLEKLTRVKILNVADLHPPEFVHD